MEAQTSAWTILAAVWAGLILAAVIEFGVRAERLAKEVVAQWIRVTGSPETLSESQHGNDLAFVRVIWLSTSLAASVRGTRGHA